MKKGRKGGKKEEGEEEEEEEKGLPVRGLRTFTFFSWATKTRFESEEKTGGRRIKDPPTFVVGCLRAPIFSFKKKMKKKERKKKKGGESPLETERKSRCGNETVLAKFSAFNFKREHFNLTKVLSPRFES